MNSSDNTVTKLSLAGATLGTFATGTGPTHISCDGTHMWVADYSNGAVTEL